MNSYINDVGNVIYNKIKLLSNGRGNDEYLRNMSLNAAMDLYNINVNNFGDYGEFDEFIASQLDSNCTENKYQIMFDELLGTIVNINWLGDSVDDLYIQIVNNENDYNDSIAIIEDKNGKTIYLKNDKNSELRMQFGNLYYSNNDKKYIIENTTLTDFNQIINLFRNNELENVLNTNSYLIEEKSCSISL